jgi:hypothetical protein
MADAIATALAKVSIAEGGWNLDATFFMDVSLYNLLLVKLHGAKYA